MRLLFCPYFIKKKMKINYKKEIVKISLMFESITEGKNGKMEGVHRACMDTWP